MTNFTLFSILILYGVFGGVKQQFSGRCRDNTVGYFPKCHCDAENDGFDGWQCMPMCPSISDGIYPNCKCRYGWPYDNATNSCPHPECPQNTTNDSIFPNCNCTGQNYEYNKHLNECHLVCPEDSVGYYPNCICNDTRAGFNKVLFECMQCPAGSTSDSTFPNCKPQSTENATFDSLFNEFKMCHPGSYGKYPNCICENGNEYQPIDSYRGLYKAGCSACSNYNGTFPDCGCPADYVHDGQSCKKCPFHSVGQFPNCRCTGNYVYYEKENECRKCPDKSTGIYPNCVCQYPLRYRIEWNDCLSCPQDATGVFPFCRCTGKNAGFDKQEVTCYDCPSNSRGRHPNCVCNNRTHIYDRNNKQCNIPCENGIDAYPYCECESLLKQFLDKNTAKCLPYAYPGRPCPPSAIGFSPECHCVQNGYYFIEYGWGCFNKYFVGFAPFACVGPFCDDFEQSIDPKLLISLVG